MQFEFNNAKSAITGYTPNEVVLGFSLNDVYSLLYNHELELLNKPQERLQAYNAIVLIFIRIKKFYNNKRNTRFFEVGDRVLIKLDEQLYTIPQSISPKYSLKFARPFTVVQQIGRSAYKLELPDA